MKKVISTSNAPAAIGPYSQAIMAGDFLYVSGQIGIVPATGNIAEGGIEAQANQVFENLKAILTEAGLGFKDVVKATVLLKDIGDFAIVNAIYGKYFEGCDYPARAAFQVGALPKDAMVEIEVIAYKG